MERLHSVDDAFRQQLESVQAAHQADLLQLAKQKEEQIEQANQKVSFCTFLQFSSPSKSRDTFTCDKYKHTKKNQSFMWTD